MSGRSPMPEPSFALLEDIPETVSNALDENATANENSSMPVDDTIPDAFDDDLTNFEME